MKESKYSPNPRTASWFSAVCLSCSARSCSLARTGLPELQIRSFESHGTDYAGGGILPPPASADKRRHDR